MPVDGTQTLHLSLLDADDPLRLCFVEIGEAVEASGNRPLLIGDPQAVWMVETGHVEVFTVAVEDGEPVGARAHFLSVGAGGCLFGMDLERYGMGSGFLAVGRMGTVLRSLTVPQLKALSRQKTLRPRIAAVIDAWVYTLSKRLTRDVVPTPRAGLQLAPGDSGELSDDRKARARRGVVWLDVERGNLLFSGMEGLFLESDERLFPLASSTWVEASNEPGQATLLTAAAGADVLAGERHEQLWAGLELFHETLCQCEFINKRLAAVDELHRLRTKADYATAMRRAAFHDLLSVLEPDAGEAAVSAEAAAADDVYFEACRMVGEAAGLEMRDHPASRELTTNAERLMAIAKASRSRTRTVALRGEWWRLDHGPILGETAEGSDPVALLPRGTGSYVCVDRRAGTRRTVDAGVAAELADFATVFYRPLPTRPLGAFDLVRFGVFGLAGDLRYVVAMGFAVGMIGALTPYFTGKVFDSAIPQADRSLLVQFGAAVVVGALIAAAFQITQAIAMLRVQGRMDFSIQAASFFRGFSAGDLAERAAGIRKIRSLLAGAGISAILGAMSSVFFVVLMFVYSARLAMVAIFLTLLFVGFSTAANYLRLRDQRQELELTGKISGLVLQLISGISKLRVSGAEDHAFRVWARSFAAKRRLEFRIGRIANYVAIFNSGFPVVSSLIIFATLVKIRGGGSVLTAGQFIAFNAAYLAFLTAIQKLSDASLNLLQVVPIYERLRPILVATPEVGDDSVYPGELSGRIEISHLHFRYQAGGPWILQDVSLAVEPGEFVALVGGSGSGKSTLMRLMLGFEKPEKGSIYYDGQDLATLDLREVRQQFGVVLQDSRLMPTDIFRNIVGPWPALTVDDAWNAAEKAGIADDVRKMPMGMHTYVSPDGGSFSGGQKQRLLIARSLVHKPRVLFFDEATSALDNRAQAVVTESMERLQATRIVIAHRLSTIRNADRICVLDGGEIVETGTFEELVEQDGRFAELARRQMA
jgi:ATP-binding cassette subfamily C protein